MKDVYLLAHPAGHSISPTMHNAAFKHLGLAFNYQAYDVPPEKLADAIAMLRQENTAGSNVTVPHKQAVMPYMDSLSDVAKQIGAVNTIVNKDGKLHGDNTDASGYLRSLQDIAFSPEGKTVTMIGAGGAARAVLYAMLEAKASKVYIYNRTTEKAAALAHDFANLGDVATVTIDNLKDTIITSQLLINTTSVGMVKDGIDPRLSPIPDDFLPLEGLVSDIIYKPRQPRLLANAAKAGLATQHGLGMLVYQGAFSQIQWTGVDAPTEVMFKSIENLV